VAVTTQRLNLVVLAVVTSLALAECQPTVPTPVENRAGRPLAQKKASPKVIHSIKADENLIRVRLLMAEAVQKDLSLTADQMGKSRGFVKANWELSREFVAKWPDFLPSSGEMLETSDARVREFQVWLKDWQSKQKELRVKLVAMLTPSQRGRLEQIQLQWSIATALAKPELIKALDISEEQLEKIRPLCDRLVEKQLADSDPLGGLAPKELRKKSIELSKERDRAQAEMNKLALEVLAPDQRTKLEKFVGKAIEVTWDYEALAPDDVVF
jgi:hypothetical protein